jgi:ATP dependent DNA ligase domain
MSPSRRAARSFGLHPQGGILREAAVGPALPGSAPPIVCRLRVGVGQVAKESGSRDVLKFREQHPPPRTNPVLDHPAHISNHQYPSPDTTSRRQPASGRVQSTSRVAIVRSGEQARLWTRNRHDISDRFPDIVTAATRQLPDGVVLDGELVILGADGRLSFDALQQRLVTSPAKAAELQASFAAFDLLAANGIDLRTQRWTVRPERLEQLARDWVPPLQLTPATADIDEATEWFEVLPAAMGVEGLVVKGAATRYTPGRRDAWVKVKHRETREVIVGGVLGSITHPEVVIAGLYTADGELVVVGRTVALKPEQAAQLAAVLTPRGPVIPGRTRSPPTGGAAPTPTSH